jgi:pimeloyl-ACP methyl ester carboxylesterase
MDLDPRHRLAVVEGCRLHWLELGESTAKPPLVLLHGLTDCHLTWKEVGRSLMRDRRVLVLDLPGHGLSGHPDASYELPGTRTSPPDGSKRSGSTPSTWSATPSAAESRR